jgi:hypothetical protein
MEKFSAMENTRKPTSMTRYLKPHAKKTRHRVAKKYFKQVFYLEDSNE